MRHFPSLGGGGGTRLRSSGGRVAGCELGKVKVLGGEFSSWWMASWARFPGVNDL